MRSDKIDDSHLPGTETKEDLTIKTVNKTKNDDDNKIVRYEFKLTKKEKEDMFINCERIYGIKPVQVIKMLLKEKGII
ncbi:hypothetical protein CRU98_04520 [Arcobacter sp. CECT 8986]|uniref:hypothetical protein n=1 Tax=Arcobacter sp. CECT 8986 TaxID=2044507 RepID=UPI0010098672|nr:hypothetical protein [Arcobacter sp. CECT 8986]RXK00427.1 hypothetical protein CRU98_04520 [Arcobacter sp. CECT 8986]